jgi:hypothetical protein
MATNKSTALGPLNLIPRIRDALGDTHVEGAGEPHLVTHDGQTLLAWGGFLWDEAAGGCIVGSEFSQRPDGEVILIDRFGRWRQTHTSDLQAALAWFEE